MKFLDCCGEPSVRTIRVTEDSYHDSVAILQCESCQALWHCESRERINWDGGPDDVSTKYTPMTRGSTWIDDNGTIRRVA